MALPPHLAPLRPLLVGPEAAEALRAQAARLPAWVLDGDQRAELDLLLGGGFAPLRGYLGQAETQALRATGRLAGGDWWPGPLALAVGPDFASQVHPAQIHPGLDIALADAAGRAVAILSITDLWREDAETWLAGPVKGLAAPAPPGPNALRARFREAGAQRVLAVPCAAWPGSAEVLVQAQARAAALDAALLVLVPQAGASEAGTLGAGALETVASGSGLSGTRLCGTGAPLVRVPRRMWGNAGWLAVLARSHGATHLVLDAPCPVLPEAPGIVILPR
ncbi:MAG: hypothetical protein QM682_15210 [Paracoccus sp. (in: a-proteobacteria)]|uniref:hypothetical protein n=1 Tax=Paracoccus sp. TaxID=267 RepID=UPI0039E5699B